MSGLPRGVGLLQLLGHANLPGVDLVVFCEESTRDRHDVIAADLRSRRIRTAMPAQAMTATPPRTVGQVSSSRRSSAAQMMLSTGWTSCTWLTCAIGPMASPRYQAK